MNFYETTWDLCLKGMTMAAHFVNKSLFLFSFFFFSLFFAIPYFVLVFCFSLFLKFVFLYSSHSCFLSVFPFFLLNPFIFHLIIFSIFQLLSGFLISLIYSLIFPNFPSSSFLPFSLSSSFFCLLVSYLLLFHFNSLSIILISYSIMTIQINILRKSFLICTIK